jgi:DNA invertase Pin-like site-specific DNA recombinase
MKAAIYVRVSTAMQSLDSQLAALRGYAKQRGFDVVEEFTDQGVSGGVVQRPALSRLMDQARKRRFDAVLVFRFDRFARSVTHLTAALTEFRNLGVAFLSYSENIDTSSPIGEAIFTICAAMAQLEKDIIRERVRAGLAAAKSKGRIGGRRRTIDPTAVISAYSRLGSLRATALELGIAKSSVQLALKAYRQTVQKTEAKN